MHPFLPHTLSRGNLGNLAKQGGFFGSRSTTSVFLL